MADTEGADAMLETAATNDTAATAVTRETKKKAKKKKRKKNKKRSKDDLDDEAMIMEKKKNQSSAMISRSAKRQKLSTDNNNDETKTNHAVEGAKAKEGKEKEVGNTVTTAQSVSSVSKKKRKKKKKKDRRVKNPNTTVVVADPGKEEPSSSVVQNQVQKQDEESEIATFPYPTDPDDHCESPIQAYCHIQPFLLHLLESRNINNGNIKRKKADCKDLRIYDPYYCNGAVIDNLTMLGFPNVYNKKEDCYKAWESKSSSSSYPEFDLILTNPPYSGDHIEKLIQHLTSVRMGETPWFLLLPDWVHKKDYFVNRMKEKQIQPFYLVPKKRYVYLPPKNYRTAKKSDVHKKSSPFNSMWYIWGGTTEQTNRLIQHYYDKRSCLYPFIVDSNSNSNSNKMGSGSEQEETATTTNRTPLSEACDLARSKSALRDLRRKVKKK